MRDVMASGVLGAFDLTGYYDESLVSKPKLSSFVFLQAALPYACIVAWTTLGGEWNYWKIPLPDPVDFECS